MPYGDESFYDGIKRLVRVEGKDIFKDSQGNSKEINLAYILPKIDGKIYPYPRDKQEEDLKKEGELINSVDESTFKDPNFHRAKWSDLKEGDNVWIVGHGRAIDAQTMAWARNDWQSKKCSDNDIVVKKVEQIVMEIAARMEYKPSLNFYIFACFSGNKLVMDSLAGNFAKKLRCWGFSGRVIGWKGALGLNSVIDKQISTGRKNHFIRFRLRHLDPKAVRSTSTLDGFRNSQELGTGNHKSVRIYAI